MKYLAEDGSVFENEQACSEYERSLTKRAQLRNEVQHYLAMRDFASDGARRRSETVIMGWIDYDLKQRGERYGHEYRPIEVDKPS